LDYFLRIKMASSANSLRKPTFMTIEQLKPGSSGHNLIVKVISTNVVVEKHRPDGTKIRVAEALVGDHTGCITLTARNNQIDAVQPGNILVIRNSKIDMFGGFMRLAVDKWGKIAIYDQPAPFTNVKDTNNLSTVEYELVTVSDEGQ
jgi:replication factor A1